MIDREKGIKGLESLRDICNAKSNMAIGKGKVAWAGYANAADDAISLLKEQPEIVRCKDCKFFISEGHYCKIRGIGRPLEPDDFCSDGMAVK